VDDCVLERFALNWNMQIRETHRKIRKPVPLKIMDFHTNLESFYLHTEDLDCYEITISKNDFQALAEFDSRNREIDKKLVEQDDYIKHLKRQDRIAIRARTDNPAVKKAWDNYCTLMNLVYHEYVDRY
jgi:hypothetical protein